VANADHSLKGSDAYETLLACYNAVLYHEHLPQFSWSRSKEGSLRLITVDTPSVVKLWQATDSDARDFRLETFGPKWEGSMLEPQSHGVYVAKLPPPPKGWTAFFIELTFPSGASVPFKFTTQVSVVPDLLPYGFVPAGRAGAAQSR
jgi:PhoPQ-activated pathogenicity-related protein